MTKKELRQSKNRMMQRVRLARKEAGLIAVTLYILPEDIGKVIAYDKRDTICVKSNLSGGLCASTG